MNIKAKEVCKIVDNTFKKQIFIGMHFLLLFVIEDLGTSVC
jgi:hypothetical protein